MLDFFDRCDSVIFIGSFTPSANHSLLHVSSLWEHVRIHHVWLLHHARVHHLLHWCVLWHAIRHSLHVLHLKQKFKFLENQLEILIKFGIKRNPDFKSDSTRNREKMRFRVCTNCSKMHQNLIQLKINSL